METLTTNGIKISVENYYQPNQSKPEQNQYVFAYNINIENKSTHTIQLLRRHWYIFDAIGERREVMGEGVIGKQPILKPGESHSYTSWCPLVSGIGKMHGTFSMIRLTDDARFEVEVPEFKMIEPPKLN